MQLRKNTYRVVVCSYRSYVVPVPVTTYYSGYYTIFKEISCKPYALTTAALPSERTYRQMLRRDADLLRQRT